MKILKFNAENVKRLKVVDITPEGNIVKITGANEAGKSSVLDSIEMALTGKKASSGLHRGEKKGKVELDLGEFKIIRTFTEGKSYLKVETKDGFERRSPQKFLDELVGAISFDPMNFINAPALKQRQILLDFAGINLDEIDRNRKAIFEERTLENRILRTIEAKIETHEIDPDLQEEPISVTDLVYKLDEIRESNSEINKIEVDFENVGREMADTMDSIDLCKSKIKECEDFIRTKKEEIKSLQNRFDSSAKLQGEIQSKIDNFQPQDESEIREQLDNSESLNERIIKNNKAKALLKEREAQKAKIDSLTRKIDKIDSDKLKTIENSKLPIKELSFTDNSVIYRGIELSEVSSSEKIRVGLSISMALNPKLKVLRITDGSLLDKKSMAIVAKMVKDTDYQVWIEVVDDSGKVGFYIEDGSLEKIEGRELCKK